MTDASGVARLRTHLGAGLRHLECRTSSQAEAAPAPAPARGGMSRPSRFPASDIPTGSHSPSYSRIPTPIFQVGSYRPEGARRVRAGLGLEGAWEGLSGGDWRACFSAGVEGVNHVHHDEPLLRVLCGA